MQNVRILPELINLFLGDLHDVLLDNPFDVVTAWRGGKTASEVIKSGMHLEDATDVQVKFTAWLFDRFNRLR